MARARAHSMPFGAEPSGDGAVRFRLWAPDARSVELCLEEAGAVRLLAMPAAQDGWFALTTAQAGAGTRYRYRIDGTIEIPDPASRFQPQGVHGPSEVVDSAAYP